MRIAGLRRLSLLLGFSTVMAFTMVRAQLPQPVRQATLQTLIGDVFEIAAVTRQADAQFTWILTRDGQFIEASKERFLHTRLTEPGTYLLDGHVFGSARDDRILVTIEALPREARPQWMDATGSPDDIVAVQRKADIVTLAPLAPVAGNLVRSDFDAGFDSNGDAVPENDDDAALLLFSTERNVLFLWNVTGEDITLALSATAEQDGRPLQQQFTLGDENVSSAPPIAQGQITTVLEENGTVRFSYPLDPSILPEDVVSFWSFGDGRQSMLDSPVHRYGANGQYTASVTVRRLQTSQIVQQGTTTVQIQNVIDAGTSSSASSSSAPATPNGSTGLGGITKIVLILLGLIILGALAVWAMRKMLHREGRLQKTLEQAEASLLKKSPAPDSSGAAIDVPAAALTLQPEAQAPEPVAPTPEPAPPPPPDAKAPAWLEKGLKAQPASTPEPAPAIPDQISAPPSLPPEPAPLATATAPVPEPVPPAPPEPLREPTPPPPAPIPEPPAPSTPAPEPEPAPAPQPPMTEDEMLPDWMKEGVARADDGVATASEGDQGSEETVSAPSPAPVPPPPSLPSEPSSALDRQREFKRRKRQRYRENVRKRKEAEAKTSAAPSPSPSQAAPAAPQTPTTPSTQSQPPTTSDDDVKFVIRAEGVTDETPPTS